ncbi:peptidoglycan editing factor PgeF [Rugamonas apoptosis]|uniref:Purine nucleoside phosphorylase n=1 Tax=Rugamonas apoptosis TaxID=2758570 RepID=A0A7W2F9F2_9BURK|nr:peptidoglycan editing factor PgeF [Rugamonas apoptosis]MBA5687522.1 peptidoglycan editing factor PgeF [Rugamonas apoptosis]
MPEHPSWLIPHWPGLPAGVGALSTTRRGGVSLAPYGDGAGGGGLNLGVHVNDTPAHVLQNRARLRAALPAEPAWLTQVHGTVVAGAAAVSAAQAAGADSCAGAPEADASIATAPAVVCAVMTADCLPVLFCDRAGTVVAAAHAGWRGLAGGVLGRTVAAMRAAGADDILAWLGPAIGPSQFEVGADVLEAFLDGAASEQGRRLVRAAFQSRPGPPGKYLADIYALARHILRGDGVEQVAGGEYCTVTEASRFYSYRRDGVTGRQASLVWLK